MDKDEFEFLMYCRIILAKEFKIPPDDINLIPIFDCAKRAINEWCLSDADGPVLEPKGKEEQKEILSEHGSEVVRRIFDHEAPFMDWAEKYEEICIQKALKERNKY